MQITIAQITWTTPPIKKTQKQATIDAILRISKANNITEPGVLLAIADVETGGKFNANAKCRCCGAVSKHVGLYQMSNNYSIVNNANFCKGDDRFCIEKSTIAVGNKLQHSRAIIEKKRPGKDVYYYQRIHNPGLHKVCNQTHPLLKKFDRKLKEWREYYYRI